MERGRKTKSYRPNRPVPASCGCRRASGAERHVGTAAPVGGRRTVLAAIDTAVTGTCESSGASASRTTATTSASARPLRTTTAVEFDGVCSDDW